MKWDHQIYLNRINFFITSSFFVFLNLPVLLLTESFASAPHESKTFLSRHLMNSNERYTIAMYRWKRREKGAPPLSPDWIRSIRNKSPAETFQKNGSLTRPEGSIEGLSPDWIGTPAGYIKTTTRSPLKQGINIYFKIAHKSNHEHPSSS